jgi:cell division protein FtsL
MKQDINNILNNKRVKQLADTRNLVLYVFALIVLAITWSGVRTVQNNYDLQKQIAVLAQQNAVLELENGNAKLQNKYLQTDQYLDLAARQNLGLAAPGEKVVIVPKIIAMKYIDQSLFVNKTSDNKDSTAKSKHAQNLQDWRDFLLGRKIYEN